MEKLFIAIFAVSFFIISCNDRSDNEVKMSTTESVQSSEQTPDSLKKAKAITDSILFINQKDSLLLDITIRILTVIKNKNYSELSTYIHPSEGIRFSPYAYIDTNGHKRFSKAAFESEANNTDQKMITWGEFAGTGDSIKMTLSNYFKKFVYDVDFAKPEKRSVNKFIGGGNSLNNLLKVYKGCNFTENYFSGFDKKYEGMDWRTLRLVFKELNNRFYLVGVVHDEWTI